MTNTMDKYFNIRYHKSAVILELDCMIFLENESYSHKENLEHVLDKIEHDTSIDVLIISNNHPNYSLKKYSEKWNFFYEGTQWESNILRVLRTYDELFLKIKSLKKTVISMNSKSVNFLLFSFSMVADLRCVSNDVIIDNNKRNLVNIPKGAVMFSELDISFNNPFKLMFLLNEISADSLYKRQLIDRVYFDDLESEVLKIAEHLSTFDYIDLEPVKISIHKKLNILEDILQKENKYLLACIRTKINQ